MENSCPNCGNLVRDATCVTCLAEQSRCVLCLKTFEMGDTVMLCKECLYLGHADEMKQWLQLKAICPVCRLDYTPELFQEETLQDRSLEEFVMLRNKILRLREEIFDQFKFRLPFYDFQSSLVLQIKKHFDKNHSFLLVSPPGSGKTIVGLALVRELGKHALILTPNLAVLGSWLERAAMFFDPIDANLKVQHVIGKEKGFLRPITIMTYQKLNQELRSQGMERKKRSPKKKSKGGQASKNKPQKNKTSKKDTESIINHEPPSLLERLKAHDIGLIILDEAHRLTQQWGDDVRKLLRYLPNAKVLGLTATPPEKMNEDFQKIFPRIDADIPRHLLVREGILVPYQDLVQIVSLPRDTEDPSKNESHDRHQQALDDPLKRFKLECHQELNDLERYLQEMIDAFVKACAIILKIPKTFLKRRYVTKVTRSFDARPLLLPRLTALTSAGQNPFQLDNEDSNKLWNQFENLLGEIGDVLIKGMKPESLTKNKELTAAIEKLVAMTNYKKHQSMDKFLQDFRWLCWNLKVKLYHVLDVLRYEYRLMGDSIRAMIILDQENLPSRYSLPIKGIHGAIGAFESLVTTDPFIDELDPIMVTGKTILVDDDLAEKFLHQSRIWAEQQQLNVEFYMRRLVSKKYAVIGGKGSDWSTDTYTRYITWLFEQGITKCLVGTRFLLGEGWDSLTLNTLLDLTTIAAETTVNQVKGRALRKDPNNPDKVTNIWEFITHPRLTPHSHEEYNMFVRKHENYWGIDEKGNIRNGVARIDSRLRPKGLRTKAKTINARSLQKARDRLRAKKLWKVGVKLGELYYGFNFRFTATELMELKIDPRHLEAALKCVFNELTKTSGEEELNWRVLILPSPKVFRQLNDLLDDEITIMVCTPVTTRREIVEPLLNSFRNPAWDDGLVIRVEPKIHGLPYRLYKWAKIRRGSQTLLGRLARYIHEKTKEKYFLIELQRERGLFFPHPIPSSTSRMGWHRLDEEEKRDRLLKCYISDEVQVYERITVSKRVIPAINNIFTNHLDSVVIEHFYIDD